MTLKQRFGPRLFSLLKTRPGKAVSASVLTELMKTEDPALLEEIVDHCGISSSGPGCGSSKTPVKTIAITLAQLDSVEHSKIITLRYRRRGENAYKYVGTP